MSTIAEAIIAMVTGWDVQPDDDLYLELEGRIFGKRDPYYVAQCVEDFCAGALGSPVKECIFWSSHLGSVYGVLLADTRRVVVKAHPLSVGLPFLTAMRRVLHHLAERRFPCPPPILGPVPIGNGYAMVEEYTDRGEFQDAHDPQLRRAMARTLATLVVTTAELGPMPYLRPFAVPAPQPGRLWPPEHHALYNFAATAAGADWIDNLARMAQQVLDGDSSPFVIGHTDWSAKHFRFSEAIPTVIYDWDSLSYVRESTIVGIAATLFTMTWELPVPLSPSPEEANAFIAEYEQARGVPFGAAEWRAIWGHVTYARAYLARCEHALHPNGTDFPPGSLRAGLVLHHAWMEMHHPDEVRSA